MGPDEPVTWEAAAVAADQGVALLAFTALPRAVGFMQTAILEGTLSGITRVARFSRAAARAWEQSAWLNPPPSVLRGRSVVFLPVDRATVESPGE
jgi:hypothetical protein